jgi:hypothetical protein
MQLKQQHFRQCLGTEHAFLDNRRFRAPINRCDGDQAAAHWKLPGYASPVRVLEADFCSHVHALSSPRAALVRSLRRILVEWMTPALDALRQ